MSPASYLTAPPRVAAESIATRETSKKLKAPAFDASYVGRKPASGRSRWSPRSSRFRSRSRASSSGRGARRRRERCRRDVRGAGRPGAAPVRRRGAAPGGAYFGWAVSELGDVDGDRVKDGDRRRGRQRRRRRDRARLGLLGPDRPPDPPLRRRGGRRERASRSPTRATPTATTCTTSSSARPGTAAGHVDLYSGRTGALLHRFVGAAAGDAFGWSVSSAGDVDRDHRADVLSARRRRLRRGTGPGYAVIYSGRTYQPIRTLTGDAARRPVRLGRRLEPGRQPRPRRRPDRRRPQRRPRAARPGIRLLGQDRRAAVHDRGLTARRPRFGSFFVAGVGDVNGDGTPGRLRRRLRGHDRTASTRRQPGRAGGRLLRPRRARAAAWLGDWPGAGLGPGRGAGDVNDDGRPDLIVGSYTSNAGAPAGRQGADLLGRRRLAPAHDHEHDRERATSASTRSGSGT